MAEAVTSGTSTVLNIPSRILEGTITERGGALPEVEAVTGGW
jgi:hypothetical protein